MRWYQVQTLDFAVQDDIVGVYLINQAFVNAGFDVSNIQETKDGKINLNEYKPKEGFTDDENNEIC